jgi:hypothetical protein
VVVLGVWGGACVWVSGEWVCVGGLGVRGRWCG